MLPNDQLPCFHCGDACKNHKLDIGTKSFCCNGCRSVYLLLNEHTLEEYYCLNKNPGTAIKDIAPEKFRFLDDKNIAGKILSFNNSTRASATLYLPQIHCSSCLWLLENLNRINPHILSSQINFPAKELSISFEIQQLSLRGLVELLTSLGYEPHLNFEEPKKERQVSAPGKTAYKIGITGFCFANIMLISFPEYLGLQSAQDARLITFFRYTNLLLALPVFFYGAQEFFRNAWFSIKQRHINIDAPIALAIAVTFTRSVYEILSNIGAGYLDSMSGIVFFMLLGRAIQNRTYSTLSFNRDYKSYFPIAVTITRQGKELVIPVHEVSTQDIMTLRHQEIIPADCILSRGKALIDYSFITGESTPEHPLAGDLIYTGGRVAGSSIEVIVIKDFNQSSFTKLWHHEAFRQRKSGNEAITNLISRYFSLTVLLIASGAFAFWQVKDPGLAWNALTAVLIVACPCSLLLTTTFTNGYLMAQFAAKGLFLKDAGTIENMARISHIAFDKTGTLTEARQRSVRIVKMSLSPIEKELMLAVISQSVHPLSRAIAHHYGYKAKIVKGEIQEIPGKGLDAWIAHTHIKIGSKYFVSGVDEENDTPFSEVLVSVNEVVKAHFSFDNQIKPGVAELLGTLSKDYGLSMVSGDNESSKGQLQSLFPPGAQLAYRQSPLEKLKHVQALQANGEAVMMIGDGLNDAGALQQSEVGVAVVAHSFSFSPACEAIIEAGKLSLLPGFLRQAQKAQRLIITGFIYSLLFNLVGISFAVTAHMSPLVAAILMPSSSLGIILIAYMGIKMITRNSTDSPSFSQAK